MKRSILRVLSIPVWLLWLFGVLLMPFVVLIAWIKSGDGENAMDYYLFEIPDIINYYMGGDKGYDSYNEFKDDSWR